MRNHKDVRIIFCSIATIICYASKTSILDDLHYKFNFKIENLYDNLKAPNIEYKNYIYLQHDPKEYIIPFNELIYHLNETHNRINITYWINWIIHYDSLCNSKKKQIFCQPRDIYVHKNEKMSRNIIWILWDIILKKSNSLSKDGKTLIQNLFDLFVVKYTPSINKKRKYIIYHCVEILLNKSINSSIPLIREHSFLNDLETNINVIFSQLKKNESHEVPEGVVKEEEKTKNIKFSIFQNALESL